MDELTPGREERVRESKAGLRKRMLERRSSEDPARLEALSLRVAGRLESLPQWRECRFPCIYISSKPGEVATHGLIAAVLVSGKRVCVPLTRPGVPDLEIVELIEFPRLVPGHFGLLDPAPGAWRPLSGVVWDLVLAPGVAFDRGGGRVGFGRGYYDRLLARARVPAVGLAFSFQIVDTIETLSHDVGMDYIVTEEEIIHTARQGETEV